MTAEPTAAHLRRMVDETRRIYAGEQLQFMSPLDERKLTRPSFKFILDVVRELMAKTRILRDVFSPADFDSKRSSDRHARVEFVQKLINFVARNKHPAPGCVASKIIAGSDPIKTNELLQNLAKVALVKLQERSRSSSRSKPPVRDVSATKQRLSAPKVVFTKDSLARRSSSRKSSEVQQQQQREPEVRLEPEPETRQVEEPKPEPEVTSNETNAEAENLGDLISELENLGPKLEELAKLDRCLAEKLELVYSH